jgi:hypothetical protein
METIIDFLKKKATVKEDAFLLPQDFILERNNLESKYGVEFTRVLLQTIYDNINLIKE